MDSILEIAAAKNLYVIEDACQAHGARYKGRTAGSLGTAAAFSFIRKESGRLWRWRRCYHERLSISRTFAVLRNWGIDSKYHHKELGLNSRLDSLQAAVLDIKVCSILSRWNQLRRDTLPTTIAC